MHQKSQHLLAVQGIFEEFFEKKFENRANFCYFGEIMSNFSHLSRKPDLRKTNICSIHNNQTLVSHTLDLRCIQKIVVEVT